MPDLLFELFSEEIPARMQAQACIDLRTLVTDALVARGLLYEGAAAFATPRRLTLHIAGLPARQPDVREVRRGPRVGAPEAAVQGFLKSAGLSSIDEASVETDPKKGSFYVAHIERAGSATLDVLAQVLPAIVKSFPWPKSMRWGAGSTSPEAFRWVRPLHAITATFGPETEEPDIVPFSVYGIAAGGLTWGHRFMSPGALTAKRFDDYAAALLKAKVVLDPERRRDIILHDARNLAFAQGLELVEDEGLLAETAGLVEWPVVLMGAFDAAFLRLPREVVRATIRANQKCFVTRRGEALADRFIMVANIAAADGGAAIVAGNERVVRARLSDADYFFQTDLKVKLEDRLPRLDAIVFHERLGTQGARVSRLAALAAAIAPHVGADPTQARRAARLAKADLVTEMVGEFPELQGLMGRTYALAQGEAPEIAAAIEEHYKPQGPGDRTPTQPVSIAVALADKLDLLADFWSIDEKPTGSRDPFALRRAALGIVRIVLEGDLRLPLAPFLARLAPEARADLFGFIVERLRVYLRDKGARHDLIDAVFAAQAQDDLALLVARLAALEAFLKTDDGVNLLAGHRRAVNILRAEEKKDGAGAYDVAPLNTFFMTDEENVLAQSVERADQACAACLKAEDFAGAMHALAKLRGPVDAFFDKVTVNAQDPRLRLNRLQLLAQLRNAMQQVADFGRVQAA